MVRFIVEDDKAQSAGAKARIQRIIDTGGVVLMSDVVLCETVLVLAGAYELGKGEIVGALTKLVGARHVRLESGPDRESSPRYTAMRRAKAISRTT